MDFIKILEEAERFQSVIEPIMKSNAEIRNVFINDLHYIAKKFSLYNDNLAKENLITGIYVYSTNPEMIKNQNRLTKPENWKKLPEENQIKAREILSQLGKGFLQEEYSNQDSIYLSKHFRDAEFFNKLAATYYRFALILTRADGLEMSIMKSDTEKLKQIYEEIYGKKIKTGKDEKENAEEETLEMVLFKLNELIGMENVKNDVKTLINFIRVQKERMERGLMKSTISLHTVFYGPPGTGKTTVARLMGKIFKAMGLLQKGGLIETDRSGMVAGYVGQTAEKVDKIVTEAMDGILFIDEAYTLKPEVGGSDYGQEAIDTLLKRMEDNRDKLVVIVAGYKDEMDRFLESNPGLKSRFNRYFYFDDYKPEELLLIFSKMANDGNFELEESGKEKLSKLFTELYNNRNKSFGNGRLVRNIFEKSIERQANRLANLETFTNDDLTILKSDDIPEKV